MSLSASEASRQQSFRWQPSQPKADCWLTLEDVCAATKLVDSTIRKYAALGKLKAYRVGDSNHLRFRQSDVDSFMMATPAKSED
ncbi:helix-turn-helix domain-containing protein [Mycobacterium sp.]|uniref:helix-turn-helix domain-containing protein n=1 Tax=Mycobacterium sp. TaxID=1785 RepID=UPI003F97BF72